MHSSSETIIDVDYTIDHETGSCSRCTFLSLSRNPHGATCLWMDRKWMKYAHYVAKKPRYRHSSFNRALTLPSALYIRRCRFRCINENLIVLFRLPGSGRSLLHKSITCQQSSAFRVKKYSSKAISTVSRCLPGRTDINIHIDSSAQYCVYIIWI